MQSTRIWSTKEKYDGLKARHSLILITCGIGVFILWMFFEIESFPTSSRRWAIFCIYIAICALGSTELGICVGSKILSLKTRRMTASDRVNLKMTAALLAVLYLIVIIIFLIFMRLLRLTPDESLWGTALSFVHLIFSFFFFRGIKKIKNNPKKYMAT